MILMKKFAFAFLISFVTLFHSPTNFNLSVINFDLKAVFSAASRSLMNLCMLPFNHGRVFFLSAGRFSFP